MKAFVFAEKPAVAAEFCAAARTMADEVEFVALGDFPVPAGIADTVLHVAVPAGSPVDDAAETIAAAFDERAPELVLAESTRHLKAIVGKLAAHAGTSVITDVLSVEDGSAQRLYFGGVGQMVQKPCGAAFYTAAAGTFGELEPAGANNVVELAWVAPANPMTLVETCPLEKSGVDLGAADVIVGAGRGFAEEEQLDLARALCERIGAALGCTRPLTEGVEWLPKETYIGVSGQMLAPKVYVACGISGQMQHMVGCNRAGAIFAVNKDKNAPIFKQCDYGLVGDIKDVLPAVTAAL